MLLHCYYSYPIIFKAVFFLAVFFVFIVFFKKIFFRCAISADDVERDQFGVVVVDWERMCAIHVHVFADNKPNFFV